jgi:Domain of unknown function (DUF4332)
VGEYLGQDEIEQAIEGYLALQPELGLAAGQNPSTQLRARAEDLADQVEDLLTHARRLAEGDPAHVALLYCLLKQLPAIVFEPLNYVFVGRVVVPLENVMDLLIHLDTYVSGQPVQKDGLGRLKSVHAPDRSQTPMATAGGATLSAGYVDTLGPFYSALLRDHAGIRNAQDLLDKGSTPEGRAEIARLTGLGDKLVAKWVRRADLMRVTGIDGDLGELMELAGVRSVGELAAQDADSLYGRLDAMNAERHIVRNLPPVDVVKSWIAQASSLP